MAPVLCAIHGCENTIIIRYKLCGALHSTRGTPQHGALRMLKRGRNPLGQKAPQAAGVAAGAT